MIKGKPGKIWYRAVSHRQEASVITHSFVFFLSFLSFSFFLSYLDLTFALFRLLSLVFQATGAGALEQIVDVLAKGLGGIGHDADSDDALSGEDFEDADEGFEEDSDGFDFRGGDFQADGVSLLALSKWPGFFSDDVSWRLDDCVSCL